MLTQRSKQILMLFVNDRQKYSNHSLVHSDTQTVLCLSASSWLLGQKHPDITVSKTVPETRTLHEKHI